MHFPSAFHFWSSTEMSTSTNGRPATPPVFFQATVVLKSPKCPLLASVLSLSHNIYHWKVATIAHHIQVAQRSALQKYHPLLTVCTAHTAVKETHTCEVVTECSFVDGKHPRQLWTSTGQQTQKHSNYIMTATVRSPFIPIGCNCVHGVGRGRGTMSVRWNVGVHTPFLLVMYMYFLPRTTGPLFEMRVITHSLRMCHGETAGQYS